VTAEFRCEDWRGAPNEEVAPLLAREAAAWDAELGWDVAHSWRVIEPARVAGMLPGFIARDERGEVAGWTWFLERNGTLQVAALVATDAACVRALVSAILNSPEASRTEARVFSIRGVPPGIEEALEEHGLGVSRYSYMSVELGGVRGAAVGRTMRPDDLNACVELFASAYAAKGGVRAFAPRGRMDEWCEYVGNLLETDGCGVFLSDASFVIAGGGDGRIIAAIVTTSVARDVAHVAQIAVDPAFQAAGFGRRLIDAAMSAAFARGFSRMTLLVADDANAARALYAGRGFLETATFVVAGSQPRRLSSVALAGGGASTRR
jgi:ribosomal protein S18 acetylase RimI-like enzyme